MGILMDPLLTTKVKKNGFLKDKPGNKYLQSLQQIMNMRVFCKGKHEKLRGEGVCTAKAMPKYQVDKFYNGFVAMMDSYTRQRTKQKQQCTDDDDDEEEIELSVKIKNKKDRSYKHQICIDHDSQNGVAISVKSKSKKKKSKLSHLDRLKEPNPTSSSSQRK